MALSKKITVKGIPLTYHRIVSLNKITNKANIIEVASYIGPDARKEEQEYYNQNTEEPMNVYISTSYITKEYDEKETIEDAYKYLKTLDQFKKATNIK